MSDITDAGPRLKAMNDALEENDRLHAEIARLRSQPCPYVTGNVTRYCTLTQPTLTDAEREAIGQSISRLLDAEYYGGPEPASVVTLRGLLERLK